MIVEGKEEFQQSFWVVSRRKPPRMCDLHIEFQGCSEPSDNQLVPQVVDVKHDRLVRSFAWRSSVRHMAHPARHSNTLNGAGSPALQHRTEAYSSTLILEFFILDTPWRWTPSWSDPSIHTSNMRKNFIWALCAVFPVVLADDHAATSVSTLEFKNRFMESGIVPEVIAAIDPSVSFYVGYRSGDHDELLVPGSNLTVSEASRPFEFSVENLNNATNVTAQTRFLIYLVWFFTI